MTYNKRDLQPGSYDGEADAFVLRDILEKSTSRADAEKYLETVKRTWGIWIGIGDFDTKVFDLVGYQQSSSVVYTDETMPSQTGQPYLKDLCYVDKHPQPSGDGPNGSLPTALKYFYGNMTIENNKIIQQYHQSGDAHIAAYDYGKKEMLVSVGRIDKKGNYIKQAYDRPYIHFKLDDFWSGK